MSSNFPADTPDSDADEHDRAMLEAMFAADIESALEPNNLPQYYVNSFTVTLGTGDVLIVMKRNGRSVASIQVSYTVAKSFVEVLGSLIKRLEDRTGNTIMTSKFIEEKMQEAENDKASKQ